ncbi:dihydroorotase [Kordia sp. YSTF-M3]|uniref:Dihydroorotase n=1 Tax=Kordia aestuariivivens TaxID=2759037 RepID=A0ABR7Q7L2_9FLAO|nr:dihydroorotase [Kordia aestuariivivens]MBC8754556.1 dihydroorotase [Kordia aestuariivivens]
MKNHIIVALLIVFFSSSLYSQNSDSDINVGTVFTIGEVYNNNYKHINFPNANFILKKGGIANYENIKGEKVEITSVKKKKDGSLIATIKLASDKLFFNSHKYITANISEAIDKKELIRL